MKYDLRTASIIISLFLLSQFIGLFVLNSHFQTYGRSNFRSDEAGSEISYSLPLTIIVISFIFLLIFKLDAKLLLVLWYLIGVSVSIAITLSSITSFVYALFVSTALALLKVATRDDYFHNFCELLVYAGVSVILIPMLNLFNTVLLIIVISFYDYAAVFLSKHMIELAKTQFELNTFSGFMIRSGKGLAVLGGGDVLFPLLLSGVLFRDYSILPAILVIYGSVIGLLTLILVGTEDKFYPAMPFITGGSLLGLILGLFFL